MVVSTFWAAEFIRPSHEARAAQERRAALRDAEALVADAKGEDWGLAEEEEKETARCAAAAPVTTTVAATAALVVLITKEFRFALAFQVLRARDEESDAEGRCIHHNGDWASWTAHGEGICEQHKKGGLSPPPEGAGALPGARLLLLRLKCEI